MNCPNCGSVLTLEDGKGHLVCTYCRALHFPEPNEDGVSALGGESDLLCPVCRTHLAHAAVTGVRLLNCERCRGLLIDMDRFLAVVDYLRARHEPLPGRPRPMNPEELERAVECPNCRRPMHTHPYGGPGNVVIDNCPECRLNWLDYRELRRVTRGFDL